MMLLGSGEALSLSDCSHRGLVGSQCTLKQDPCQSPDPSITLIIIAKAIESLQYWNTSSIRKHLRRLTMTSTVDMPQQILSCIPAMSFDKPVTIPDPSSCIRGCTESQGEEQGKIQEEVIGISQPPGDHDRAMWLPEPYVQCKLNFQYIVELYVLGCALEL